MNKVLLIQLKTQKGGSRTCDIVLNKEDLSLVEEDQIRNVKTNWTQWSSVLNSQLVFQP